MDRDRFARSARLFGAGATRRAALALLAAFGLGAAPAPVEDVAARKKGCGACRRRLKGKCKPKPDGAKCSGGTCSGGKCAAGRAAGCDGSCANCFAAQVDPNNAAVALAYACCPAAKVCRKPGGAWPDQCCYPDETCDPGWPDREPFLADSICCRTCADPAFQGCCPATHNCVNGTCALSATPRLPRGRRGA